MTRVSHPHRCTDRPPEMVTWSADNDARLLRAIIKVHKLKVDYEMVAAEFGKGTTPRAIECRVSKLKCLAKRNASSASPNAGDDDDEDMKPPRVAKKRAVRVKAETAITSAVKNEEEEFDPSWSI